MNFNDLCVKSFGGFMQSTLLTPSRDSLSSSFPIVVLFILFVAVVLWLGLSVQW